MKTILCEIAWMKKYAGVTEDDRPIRCKDHDLNIEKGNECYNFEDYDGYCYGFSDKVDNLIIEECFKDTKENRPYIDGILVVWIAADSGEDKKIVGWYKDARLFRELQEDESFTDPNHNLFYLFKARAENSFLLPEEGRNFIVDKSPEADAGRLIAKILEYISGQEGPYANEIYSEEKMSETLHNYVIDYNRLLNQGIKHYEKGQAMDGLIFFNTARMLNETTEVLLHIADGLMHFKRFSRACEIYERVLESEGDSIDLIEVMVYLSDYMKDRERTLYYCDKLLPLLDQEKEDSEYKVYIHLIMFKIYLLQKNEIGALKKIKAISPLLAQGEDRGFIEELKHKVNEIFAKH